MRTPRYVWRKSRYCLYRLVIWMIYGPHDVYLHYQYRPLLRWAHRLVIMVMMIMTMQACLLVAGAWCNDRAIEANMGIAEAQVLSAGPRRSTIEFVTPDRITYRPELGVLYPSELATGMRIYVEYDRHNPDLVRVQHRNASLALIPAGSLVVMVWIIGMGLLIAIRYLNQLLTHRHRDLSSSKTPSCLFLLLN